MSYISMNAAKDTKKARIYAIFLIAFLFFSLCLAKSASATSAGPKDAGIGTNVADIGTSAWYLPGKVTRNDANYVTASVSASSTTNYLKATNYGFAIPVNATVNGIQVLIGRKASVGTPGMSDNVISLVKAGTVIGDNKAVVGTNWPTTEAAATYGGTDDLWGVTWTPAEINAVDFGAILSVRSTGGGSKVASVNYIQITVFYTTNNAPIATDDEITTDEDAPITASVLSNDTDADGDVLNVSAISTLPVNGTAAIQPDNTILYTPNENYNGSDSFVYTISDGNGGTSFATAYITINPVDDAPIANSDAYSTNEDTALVVGSANGMLINDTDIDNDASLFTVELVTDVTNGTLDFHSDGGFEYTPNTDFTGTDSFTYKTFDDTVYSDPATVSINVNNVNDSPVANADSFTVIEDNVLTTDAVSSVLGNDTDVENDTLNAVLIDDVSHGALVFNADGSFQYTPDENYHGLDSFTYIANDGEYDSGEAVVSIMVKSANDSPIGADKTISVDEDGAYIFSLDDFGFQDIDGDSISGVLINSVPYGTFTIDYDGIPEGAIINAETISGGHLIYQPLSNENGVGYSGFSFSVIDSSGDEASKISLSPNTMTININSVNDAPAALDDESIFYTTDQNTELIIDAELGVLSNDSDIDGDSLTAVFVSDPSHGTVTLNDDGGFDYVPETDYLGSDSFTYEAYDGELYSEPATVYLNVNDGPPQVVKAEAMSATQIRITFNELLRDDDLCKPLASDFKIYHSEEATEIPIASISYETKIVTVYLGEDIVAGDAPTYEVLPDSGDIRDHSDNVLSTILSGNVIDRIAPSFAITASPATIVVGDGVNFSVNEANDLWTGVKNYVWNFGDGNISTTTASNASHAYGTAGTYNATAQVYDNNGNSAIAGLTITVNAISSSGGGGGGSSSVSNSTTTPAIITAPTAGSTSTIKSETTTPKITGQVLGEKISRLDELIKLAKYGERSDNVRELQLELKNAGFFPKWHIVTGYFGPITLNSVKKYLASQNRLSELRNSKIDELIAVTKYGERTDNVKSLQTELKNAGFFPRYQISTGYYGPITLASVKKYQAYITL